jgi:hypothetical protein
MTYIAAIRGDREEYDITLVDEEGQPLDLTDLALTFTAKRRLTDTDANAVIIKTDGDGITVDSPEDGIAILTLTPEDTEDLLRERTLYWDVQTDDGAGDVQTPLSGRLVISADVTRTHGGS